MRYVLVDQKGSCSSVCYRQFTIRVPDHVTDSQLVKWLKKNDVDVGWDGGDVDVVETNIEGEVSPTDHAFSLVDYFLGPDAGKEPAK